LQHIFSKPCSKTTTTTTTAAAAAAIAASITSLPFWASVLPTSFPQLLLD